MAMLKLFDVDLFIQRMWNQCMLEGIVRVISNTVFFIKEKENECQNVGFLLKVFICGSLMASKQLTMLGDLSS